MSINNEKEVKKYILELEKENTELKQQLKAVKYLNRDEVEKILFDTTNVDKNNLIGEALIDENKLTVICNLALPN